VLPNICTTARSAEAAHQEGQHAASRHLASAAGFSLIEMVVVVSIVGTLCAAAAIVMPGAITQNRADSGVTTMVNTLRLARDRAVGERRNVDVRFLSTNQIQIARANIPVPPSTVVTYTVITDVYLEDGMKFIQYSGLGDTPDAFGASGPVAFASSPRMFTSEGTFVDATGDVMNGTIFFGIPGQATSARAVTIFGPTALIRSWRFDGIKWTE
jgi:prepilin-type N-terminal cleavage/methylation domain-containing protein